MKNLDMPFSGHEYQSCLYDQYMKTRLEMYVTEANFRELDITFDGKYDININGMVKELKGNEPEFPDNKLILRMRNGLIVISIYNGDNLVDINGNPELEKNFEMSLEQIMKNKYGVSEYELYFVPELVRFKIVPKLDLLSEEQKKEIFVGIISESIRMITHLSNGNAINLYGDGVVSYIKKGYVPIYVEVTSDETFKNVKGTLIAKLLHDAPHINIPKDEYLSEMKTYLPKYINSDIPMDVPYVIIDSENRKSLNMSNIKWVAVKRIVLETL